MGSPPRPRIKYGAKSPSLRLPPVHGGAGGAPVPHHDPMHAENPGRQSALSPPPVPRYPLSKGGRGLAWGIPKRGLMGDVPRYRSHLLDAAGGGCRGVPSEPHPGRPYPPAAQEGQRDAGVSTAVWGWVLWCPLKPSRGVPIPLRPRKARRDSGVFVVVWGWVVWCFLKTPTGGVCQPQGTAEGGGFSPTDGDARTPFGLRAPWG